MLTPDEIERYKRQLVLKEIGGEGQQKLKAARVLVVGAGGLGSPLHSLSGRGRRRPDRHHRQRPRQPRQSPAPDRPRHQERRHAQDRERGAERSSASIRMSRRASTPRGSCRRTRSKSSRGYDIVADGSDNFATRYLVNDACYFAKRPLVFAAVGPVRRPSHHLPRLRERPGRQAAPVLSLPVPRAAAGRHGAALLRGRHSRRGRRRDRHACGGRGGEGAARDRREPGRAAVAL